MTLSSRPTTSFVGKPSIYLIESRNHCMHTFVINKRPEKLYNEYGNMLNNGQPSEKSHDQDKLCHSALSFD